MAGDDDAWDGEDGGEGEAPPDPQFAGERVDVYACYREHEVDRILEFLSEEGIEALTRDHASSPFPTNIGTTAETLIAVREPDVSRAVATIRQAIADEVISGDGRFIET